MRNEQLKDVYTSELMIVCESTEDSIILNEILKSEGYMVRSEKSGVLALRSIAKKLPDIILLDFKTPSLDGFEICKRLKSDVITKDIPVIFISVLDETQDIISAFNLGATDFITKPFNRQEVVVRVSTHLRFRIQQTKFEKDNSDLQREKENRAAELIIANKELDFQNKEKENRAAELLVVNNEMAFQSREIKQKTKELLLAREQIEMAGVIT